MAEQTDIGEADDMKELALDVVEVEQTEAEIEAIQLDQQVAGIDLDTLSGIPSEALAADNRLDSNTNRANRANGPRANGPTHCLSKLSLRQG